MKDDLARDKALGKLVGAQVRAGLKPGDSNCLSAETLAAYIERTLTSGERLTCETHLAVCARCQEQVAALVRFTEAEEHAPATVPSTSRPARFSWFRWAYAGPVFAALLVAGIYVVGPFRTIVQQPPEGAKTIQQPIGKQVPSSQVKSQDKPTLPAEKRESAPAENQMYDLETRRASAPPPAKSTQGASGGAGAAIGTSGMPTTATPSRGRNEEALPTPPKPSQAENRVVETNGPQKEPSSNERSQGVRSHEIAMPSVRSDLAKTRSGEDAGTGGGSSAGVIGGVSGITNPPSAQRSKDDRTAGAPPQPPEASAKAAKELDALQRHEKKAKAEATPSSTTTAEVRDQDHKIPSASQSMMVTASTEAVSTNAPGEAIAWRVGRHGLIEQKDSHGNWIKRQSGVKVNLKAISFPNPNVGWAVGDDGIILRSTDGGNSWVEIHSPTSDRIVHVTATSDQMATIVTREGVTFTTTDGGNTWSTPPSE